MVVDVCVVVVCFFTVFFVVVVGLIVCWGGGWGATDYPCFSVVTSFNRML